MAEKILNIKKITPTFDNIVLTKDVYTEDICGDGGLIMIPKGTPKDVQTVLFVNPKNDLVKPGDLVKINPDKYFIGLKTNQGFVDRNSIKADMLGKDANAVYDIPEVFIDGKDCYLMTNRDISYIINEYEEIENKKSSIIMPSKKKLIV